MTNGKFQDDCNHQNYPTSASAYYVFYSLYLRFFEVLAVAGARDLNNILLFYIDAINNRQPMHNSYTLIHRLDIMNYGKNILDG